MQSETMLPGDADFPVTELTGRVGGQFKRKRISLDGPLNTVNAQVQDQRLSCRVAPCITRRRLRVQRGRYHRSAVADRLPSAASAGTAAVPATISTLSMRTERRKFTIAEVKRICAFPDDFILTGTYAQQWERLGNSVPPLMMKAIAETIRDRVLAQ